MYVAVKGGQQAIQNAHALLAEARRGDPSLPELDVDVIREQLTLAVDRVMAEGSLYDPELASLAVKQARGDLVEAAFLLRSYRTTLPRLAVSDPLDTDQMRMQRRISATYKDLPGGQVLGPTFDYTLRLLDFGLLQSQETSEAEAAPTACKTGEATHSPRVSAMLERDGLVEPQTDATDPPAGDLTRQPLELPAGRDLRLQNLARGDEGFLLALGYSTQRGFGKGHPFVAEIRMGEVELCIQPEELDFPITVGELTLTECEMVNNAKAKSDAPPVLTTGYGLSFGYNERKAMAMALVDRSLRCEELGIDPDGPAQDEEFVLMHSDNVEAQGFVQHLKLPHYVDFQGELQVLQQLREEHAKRQAAAATGEAPAGTEEERA